MARDLLAPANPDPILALQVVEEAGQRLRPRRAAGKTAMQGDGHHLGLAFALGVMVFSYSGLLGVYFVTLFSRRGSRRSVIAALITGFLVPLSMQPYIIESILPARLQFELGFTWQLVAGTLISTLICAMGNTPAGYNKDTQQPEPVQ